MCLIFSDNFTASLAEIEALRKDSKVTLGLPAAIQGKDSVLKTSLKRPANTDLNPGPTKTPKLSNQDDVATKVNTTSTTKTSSDSKEEILRLKKLVRQLQVKYDGLTERHEALNEKFEDVRNDLFAYEGQEAVEAKQKDKKKSGQASITDIAKTAVKAAQEIWKVEHREKLDDAKEDYDERVEKLKAKNRERLDEVNAQHKTKVDDLKAKHDKKVDDLKVKREEELGAKEKAYNKKLREWKLKCQQAEDETKETKAARAEEVKGLKARHKEFEKQLKEEQQKQIKGWKPEHSQAVKDKDAELKAKTKEIAELKVVQATSKEQMSKLEDKLAMFRNGAKTLTDKLEDRKEEIKNLQNARKEADKERQDLLSTHNAKIVHEGERWKVQFDKAQQLEYSLVAQQRANFILRNGNESKAQKIKDLEGRLAATCSTIGAQKADCGEWKGVDADGLSVDSLD